MTNETFNQIYSEYYPKLLSHGIRKPLFRQLNLASIEDCVQLTFLELWKCDYEKIKEHLSAWLYKVFQSKAYKLLIRKERKCTFPLFDTDLDIETVAGPETHTTQGELYTQAQELLSEISKHIQNLTPRRRAVFELYMQGVSNKLIAERLGLSQTNVNFIVSVTRQQLREKFKKHKEWVRLLSLDTNQEAV